MPASSVGRHSPNKQQHRTTQQRLPQRLQELWRRTTGTSTGTTATTVTNAISATATTTTTATAKTNAPTATVTETATATTTTTTPWTRPTTPIATSASSVNHHHRSHSAAAAYVAILVLSTTCSLCAGSPCQSFNWWDPVRDKCIPCTECYGQLIVLRPCQLHRDTICGSIYDLQIDWMVLAKTEPNWKERRKAAEMERNLQKQLKQQQQEDSIAMDWQTAALFLAVVACLLFFIVAACILIQHMRQWRRMERRLDQDVEELSAKLMARLAEVQSLEGGTFFIENADTLKGQGNLRPQHVLLIADKDRRVIKSTQPGNVYIEETGSKG